MRVIAHATQSPGLATAFIALLNVAGATIPAFASPPLSDAIKRTDPIEYRLNIDGRVETYQHPFRVEETQNMNLLDTPLVFPVLPDGGFHTSDLKKLKAKLELDDIEHDAQFEILPTAALESQLGRFLIKKFKGREVEFMLEKYITCYNALVDEEALRQVEWVDQWPPEIQSALQPQRYIESTNESVVRLMEQWTKGKAREVPPYLLAKELARRVVESYQPNGKDTFNDRLGRMAGFEVDGAAHAINEPRGPFIDGICLYVAICRAAGLPARPVIGIDVHTDEQGKEPEWAYWAEVYLPNTGWIAIDFRPLYKAPGTMRDINAAWPGFGTNDELNELVPVAYHFHPPAAVRAEGAEGHPMLWGWQPRPYVVRCEQALTFRITEAPTRAGQ